MTSNKFFSLFCENKNNEITTDEESDKQNTDTEEKFYTYTESEIVMTGLEKIDKELVDKFYKNFMKLSEKDRMNLIISMGEKHPEFGTTNSFTVLSDKSTFEARNKLAEKINEMKTKRKTAFSLKKKYDKYMQKNDYNECSDKTFVTNELSNTAQISENEISNQTCVENTNIKLSKGQKKKLREKKRKNELSEITTSSDSSELY